MSLPIVLKTYFEVIQSLEAAAAWLETETAIEVSKTRVHKTIEFLKDRVYPASADKPVQGERTNFEFSEILCSAVELITIHKGLAREPLDSVLIGKLREIAEGPFFLRDEKTSNSSNRARNIAFELHLGSFLARSGLPTKFESPTDIVVRMPRVRYYIECKRPESVPNVRDNARNARKALANKMHSDLACLENQCGVVGLEMTKLFNSHFGPLGVEKESQVPMVLEQSAHRLIAMTQSSLDKVLRRHQIGGAIEHLMIPVFVKEKGWLPVVGSQLAFYVTAHPARAEGLALKELADALSITPQYPT